MVIYLGSRYAEYWGRFDVVCVGRQEACHIVKIKGDRYVPGTRDNISGGPMWCRAVENAAGKSAECWGRSDTVCIGIM